jgi:hypothetical protein
MRIQLPILKSSKSLLSPETLKRRIACLRAPGLQGQISSEAISDESRTTSNYNSEQVRNDEESYPDSATLIDCQEANGLPF